MNKYKVVVGIHGVPRSGTSWLAQIINSDPLVKLKFQPLFSYAYKDFIDENAGIDQIKEFYDKIWSNEEDAFLNLKDQVIHQNYPTFIKSTEPTYLVFKQVHHHFILKNLISQDKDIRLLLTIRN